MYYYLSLVFLFLSCYQNLQAQLKISHQEIIGRMECLAFSPNGLYYAVGTDEDTGGFGMADVYPEEEHPVDKGSNDQPEKEPINPSPSIVAISWSIDGKKDGKKLLIGGWDGDFKVGVIDL